MSQLRSEAEIEAKVAAEGFAELKRHWRLFRKRKVSLQDLDPSQVDVALAEHVSPWGRPTLFLALVVGAIFAGALTKYSFAFVQSKTLLWILFVWSTVNLTLLVCHCVTLLRRYIVVPMEKLIGQKLALVLQPKDYRLAWSQSETVAAARDKIHRAGVSDVWDNPTYERQYTKTDSGWVATEAISPEKRIHRMLAEFLGRKDEATRKFQPGAFVNSLKNKKKSVSRFVAAHQSLLIQSREGLF